MNCKTKEVMYQKVLPKGVTPKLVRFSRKPINAALLPDEKDTVILGNGIDQYIEWEAKLNQLPVKEVDNFVDYITFDANKCLMTAPPKDAEIYIAMLQEEFKEHVKYLPFRTLFH